MRRLLILAMLLCSTVHAVAADGLGLTFGRPSFGLKTAPTAYTNFALDATTDKLGFISLTSSDEAITKLGFRYGVRTGTPPTYKISIQGVSATTGLPDGTIKGGGSPAAATFTPPADTTWDGTWREIALDNSYTPARGEVMSIVFEHSSGTCDASNNSSITRHIGGLAWPVYVANVYYATDTGAGWASSTFNNMTPHSFVTANTVVGFVAQDASRETDIATNGDRQALRFKWPGASATFKLRGFNANIERPAATNTVRIGIWNAAGTALMSTDVNADQFGHSSTINNTFVGLFDDAPAALTAGTVYYAGIERVAAACGLYTIQLASANDLKSHPGGSEFYLATWNGSTWTDVTTERPYVELILDDFTEPAGGGGSPIIGGGIVR